MKEMDCVEVIVERRKYTQDGVHKGMQAWICYPESANGSWLVNFPQYGEKDDIATISVDEEDLKLLPNGMDAMTNDRLKEYYDAQEQKASPEEKRPCMKEMDSVEVIVEKKKYAVDGVHKGMQGWICYPKSIGGTWLVNFPQYGEKDDIATIAVDETDLKLSGMDARINERIKARFDALEQEAGPEEKRPDGDNLDYMI